LSVKAPNPVDVEAVLIFFKYLTFLIYDKASTCRA